MKKEPEEGAILPNSVHQQDKKQWAQFKPHAIPSEHKETVWIFTVTEVKYCKRLPTEVLESPSAHIFKTQPDTVLDYLLLLTLLKQELGLHDLKKFPPT